MSVQETGLLGETHQVTNQPPPLENYNLFQQDTALKEALHREGGGWAESQVDVYGALMGRSHTIQLGFLANEHKPVLHTHDRFGHRIDQVTFHPAYHDLMAAAIENRLPSLPWQENRRGAHVARACLEYLHNQVDSGTGCPLTMTFASVAALDKQPEVLQEWLPGILSGQYDPTDRPAPEKRGLTLGMAMTEKQGGTDVRANTTFARPLGQPGPGNAYSIIGHKWFCSAPMCDAFLVLAQTAKGLSCFLLPRWQPDGQRNQFHIQRLKNKLGNLSNASSEVEFRGAWAVMVGEEGRGVPTIIEMVNLTRFDCMVGSSALMRQAVSQGTHHIHHRSVMGKPLASQPLMQNVMADLAIESEAALTMTLRLARALDESREDDQTRRFVRLATAIGKYWICKRTPNLAYEAMECLGGAGYVEESILPRIYREAPVNAIWEGSGNVQCMDILRAMTRDPEVVDVFFAELHQARGSHPLLDQHIHRLADDLCDKQQLEYRARNLTDRMALALQGALLVQHGSPAVAEAFCISRLSGLANTANYGNLPPGIDCNAIIERARPNLSQTSPTAASSTTGCIPNRQL